MMVLIQSSWGSRLVCFEWAEKHSDRSLPVPATRCTDAAADSGRRPRRPRFFQFALAVFAEARAHRLIAFSEEHVDHPASTQVLGRGSAMVEHILTYAAGVLQCVRQDRHISVVLRVVNVACHRDNEPTLPDGDSLSEGDRAEGIAEDF